MAPLSDALIGLVMVAAGLVAVRSPRSWVVGGALVAAGVTWWWPGLAVGEVTALFLHRALLAVALMAVVAPWWRWRARGVLVVGFVVVGAVPRWVTDRWIGGPVWLAIIAVAAMSAWPSPRRRRLMPAIASMLVMWSIASVVVEVTAISNDTRRIAYDLAAATTAVLLARAARAPIDPDVVLDVQSGRTWAVGVRAPGADDFVTIDGRPLTADDAHRFVEFDLGRQGTAVLVHDDPAFEDPRLRARLHDVVRLLAQRVVVRDEIARRAAEVERSRRRVVEADRVASVAMRTEIERTVQPHLDEMRRLLRTSGRTGGDVRRAEELLAGVTAEIRQLTGETQAPTDERLVESLRQVAAHSTIPATLVVGVTDPAIPPATARALSLVARELTANAAKHSGADQVVLELADDGDTLVLRVSDNGRGGAVVRPGGGLAEVRSRLEALGGTVDVDPSDGSGTTVTIRVTVPRPP